MNDIDVEECKRYIENYKKENKDIIKKNRLRPSASMLFYDSELEREAMLREKREKEDEERRQSLLMAAQTTSGSVSTNGCTEQQDPPNPRVPPPSSSFGRPDGSSFIPPTIKPPPTARPSLQPPSQFYSPASISATTRAHGHDRVFIPPPPSALGRGFHGAPPSSALVAPPTMCPPSASNWTAVLAPSHNQVLMPLKVNQSSRQPDAVVIPNRSSLSARPSSREDKHAQLAFTYVPFAFDMFGPPVPNPTESRWNDILDMYTVAVINRLRDPSTLEACRDYKPSDVGRTRSASAVAAGHKVEEPDVKRSRPTACGDRWAMEVKVEVKSEDVQTDSNTHSAGLSYQLPSGACGIAPLVFLERCVQESRCALYL